MPAIKKAVELGYVVITVDYLPHNVGHKYSHQYVNCSTVDMKGVLKWAKNLEIDGIMTMASDISIPTVAFVTEQLGLVGPDRFVAETFANKGKFRAFQKKNRLKSPTYITGKLFKDVKEKLVSLKKPIIFKPVDTSGSRGISKFNEGREKELFRAFNNAMEYSCSGFVCVEEYVEGIDISGDGFLLNGEFSFGLITKKYTKDFVVTGHRLPTDLKKADQELVFDAVVATCKAAGYTNGPLDFDVRVNREKATILEISPRLGGNGIPMIIERATGIDLIASTILFVMGEPVSFPSQAEILRSCGSLIFGSERAGVLKHVATPNEMKRDITEIFNYVLVCRIGDPVYSFIHGGNSLGFTLFDCPKEKTYEQMVERIEQRMNLNIA